MLEKAVHSLYDGPIDQGLDPIATITVFGAIRQAIFAWDLDVSSEVIRKCFKKALSPEDPSEIQNQELVAGITEGYRH